MAIKITIDMRMYYASGIGTYLRRLVPLLVSHRKDIEFFLIGDKAKLDELEWIQTENIKIINSTAPIYSIKEQFELKKIIPDCDLYFAPHYNVPYFHRGPMITTIHDIFHLSEENHDRTVLRTLYARTMLKTALKKSKIIMTDSQFTLNEMKKYNLPDLHKVRVVYLGYGISEPVIKDRTNDPGGYILYIGNVKPHKNLRRLIDAYKALYRDGKIKNSLMIVGEADKFITGMPELKYEIERSEWKDKIVFTGWINDDKLVQYYKDAAILVLPSLYEGFGLPPLEAMACGCPCVVSRAASLPEICGDAVLYCNPYSHEDIAEKIYTLLNDNELRRKLRSRGYKHIKNYGWQKTANHVLEIIEEATKQ